MAWEVPVKALCQGRGLLICQGCLRGSREVSAVALHILRSMSHTVDSMSKEAGLCQVTQMLCTYVPGTSWPLVFWWWDSSLD